MGYFKKAVVIGLLFTLSSCAYKQWPNDVCKEARTKVRSVSHLMQYNNHCKSTAIPLGAPSIHRGTLSTTTRHSDGTTTRSTTRYSIR